MDTKKRLKIDFNLLISGTWVIKEKEAELVLFEKEIKDGRIVITSPWGVPTPKESRLLDCLMLKSQENGWSKFVEFPSIRQLAREAKFSTRNNCRDLKHALQVLKRTVISFENCFIDTGVLEHFSGLSQIIEIGIIQGFQIREDKKSHKVKVVFDDNFLALCRHSLGYKLIPYAPIQGLRDTAYALYKWAYRWYDSGKGYGERWIGNGQSLVKWYKNELNSIAQYKYPSEVLRRLKSAIEQLNKNKEVPFCVRIKEENGNYKIELYRKEKVTLKREIPFDTLPFPVRRAIIKLIETRKKDIKSPYAYARSMNWKELEAYLNKLLILDITEGWEFVKQVLEWGNEFKTFESETLTIEERKEGESAVVVFEKSRLNKGYLATFFKAFPNLKTFLYPATDWVRGEKTLQGAKG